MTMSAYAQFLPLTGAVCHYPWGSRRQGRQRPYIAELLNRDDAALPWAELWLGAHPANPAVVGGLNTATGLDALCQQHPAEILGRDAEPQFPFLLKILSCGQPLSIQCHPDSRDARRLHQENPQLYRDANPKPETLVAVTEFRALAGFRPLPDITWELNRITAFSPWQSLWQSDFPHDCRGLCQALFALPQPARRSMLQAANRELQTRSDDRSPAAGLFLQLAAAAPDDPGAAFAFLLQEWRLQPGQALLLPPRQLHAYLHGTGIECMPPSDNVIRAGLTRKTVDLDNFWRCADFSASGLELSRGRMLSPGRQSYPVPGSAIGLEILCDGEFTLHRPSGGPGILLLLSGRGELCCPGAPALPAPAGSAWLCPAQLLQGTFRTLVPGTLAVWASV
ncbi:MAG: mannose-6-phosphate isomerase, class I [Oligosphaeraceae bacterium]|nr:mannose-6-phosphate isomerase, class I [Oligosphaeraceae bacterium]